VIEVRSGKQVTMTRKKRNIFVSLKSNL